MNDTDQFERDDGITAEGWKDETESAASLGDVIEAAHTQDAEEPIPEQEIKRELYTPEQNPVNFRATRKHSVEALPDETPVLAFIRENPNTIAAVLNRCNDVLTAMQEGKMAESDRDQKWLAAIVSGMKHTCLENAPYKALEREGSEWTDGIDTGGPQLERPGAPKQINDKSRKISKENQLAYLNSRSGQGGTYEGFLPRSGLWVRLRQPTLEELVTLQTELQALKLNLGAETKGASYSHADFIMLDLITTLALQCVIGSNKTFNTPSDLEHEITLFDEAALHHSLAATLFPGGFNYSNPCIADPDVCSAVETWKMNMANIIYYDNNVFSAEQRKFIAKRFAPATEDDFKAYRNAFSIGNAKVIWLGNIGLKLAEPTIAARRASGKQWYDGLIEMSQGVFNEPPHGNSRLNYIRKLKDATTATQYSHWVTAIYDKDDDAMDFEDQLYTDDPELILEYMKGTLSTPEYSTRFAEAIEAYCNESIIVLVGLVSHNCPVCGTEQGRAFNERLPHISPIDVVITFFTLAGRKVLHLG